MNTRSKKNKGRRLQQYVATLLLSVFPEFKGEDIRSVPASVNGPDIWLSSEAKKKIPFAIECKNQERINLYKFWEQTKKNAEKENRLPLLVVKSNRKEPLFITNEEGFRVMLSGFRTNNPNRGGKVGKEEL